MHKKCKNVCNVYAVQIVRYKLCNTTLTFTECLILYCYYYYYYHYYYFILLGYYYLLLPLLALTFFSFNWPMPIFPDYSKLG